MRKVRLFFVGAAKRPFFKAAEDEYLQGLARYVDVERVIVKDCREGAPAHRVKMECASLDARLDKKFRVIGLDERGKTMDSRAFAALFGQWTEDAGRDLAFVVGGPFGLTSELRARCDGLLALGPMTMPHELARVVLLEQLYRAANILKGTPYHHDEPSTKRNA